MKKNDSQQATRTSILFYIVKNLKTILTLFLFFTGVFSLQAHPLFPQKITINFKEKLANNPIDFMEKTTQSYTAIPTFASALLKKITGTVLDETGQPLSGATIQVKSYNIRTTSGINGQFTLNIPDEATTLLVTFVGYDTQEVPIGNNTEFTIQLKNAATSLSGVSIIGSRALPRSNVDRPVPVEVISSKDLQTTGQIELGQQIQFNSPSFNSAKTGINGAANYADPATLRGLSPDQMLVMVNGKRRHQFSALNLNVTVGAGTVVTDMNSIPAMAVDRIEVLRDGAAAQYGSDAIAGIVNMGLNQSVGKGTVKTQYGVTKEGDGSTFLGGLNYGFSLGKPKSFLNLTAQYQYTGGTDRSDNYNPEPIAGKAYTGIYSNNKKDDEAARIKNGTYGEYGTFKVSKYGSNQTKSYQGFYNLSYPVSQKNNLYSFGGVSIKDVLAYGFFRLADPKNGNATPEIFPNGYSPLLPGKTADYSTVVGLNQKTTDGWNFDFSVGYGRNNLDLWANNTTNPSMGANSPTDFFVGRSTFSQIPVEANFSKSYQHLMGTKSFNLAFGSQYRIDQFSLVKGSDESYLVGPLAKSHRKAIGSSGRPGIAPSDETNAMRSNIAFYADVESDITDRLLLATALRFENYSDFGSNISGKLAARFKITDAFSIRSSINRGFRAPSLAQTYNSVTTSTVQAGEIFQTKQLPNNNPVLAKIGVEKPKAETSWNYNIGVTAKIKNNFLVTLDAYQINISDRIILSERLIVKDIAALKKLPELTDNGISEIRFFSNHVNTTTKGIDLVTSYQHNINANSKFTSSLALTANQTLITSQKNTPSLLQEGTAKKISLIDTVSISLIETAQPRAKAHLSLGYQINKLSLNTRVSYFGPVTAQEKPTTGPHISQTFSSKTLIDLSVVYALSKKISATLGVNNLFNVYPDRVNTNLTGYFNGQIPYSRNVNQFGFNGTSFYTNLVFTF